MKSWLKENWLVVALLFILFVWVGSAREKDSETSGKWQAVYYPDGCLSCQENYIFSQFYDTVNDCIGWVHSTAKIRGNNNDAAECSYDCKKNYDLGGVLVCKETVDVLGKPSL